MTRACANCRTELVGDYCHACGQRALEGDELTVGHALRFAADEIFHLESKTLRTTGLLFKPGVLTEAYLSGRRAPFTSPMKLFLACAAFFFLCAPLAGFTLEQMLAQDSSGTLGQWVGSEMVRKGVDRALFAERFDLRFQTVYTILLFATMLGGAGMLALLFRRQGRPFGAHVVFELHYLSFFCLISIVLGLVLRWVPPGAFVSITATLGVLAPYLFIALRRVYREPSGRILWKTAAMMVFAVFFDSLVSFVALVATLRLV